jgi:hypothetical protein
MKFEQFLESKGVSFDKLNENNGRLYEAEGGAFEAIMKSIKSMMAYAKFEAMYPKYADACYNADPNIVAFGNFQKQQGLLKKKVALEDAKEQDGLDRAKKEQIIKQIDRLKEVGDTLDSQQEVKLERATQERDTMKVDIDELVKEMSENLTSIASKKLTLAGYDAKAAGLEKKGIIDKAVKDVDRENKTKEDIALLKKKRDLAVKALDDAENAGAEDIKEVEGAKNYMAEINAFIESSKKVAVEKVTLGKLRDEADGHITESEDIDSLLSYDASHILEDEISFSLDEGSEAAEAANKATPSDVLSKINAIKDKDENDKDQTELKKGLYSKLSAAADKFVAAMTAQVEMKKKLWDKVKQAPSVTKDLIEVAGGDPEKATENEDGSYKAGEPTEKWAAAFEKPEEYGPLKKATEAGAEAKEKAGAAPKEEGEPVVKKPETEVETEVEDETDTKKTETINKLKAKLDDPNLSDELKGKIQAKITKMESDEDNNSVDYDSILEEIESLIAEASTQAPKAIMKFADFIASKK